jgi:16S rRNA (adenine1518-N6/adenine1519-N6)-dimethyltransferase
VRPTARTKKSLGQHWLTDTRILERIADAAGIQPGDTVVEIGPGTGQLTRRLAERAERVIAVELDDDLARALAEEYTGSSVVRVLHGDALTIAPAEVLRRGEGGLPYVVAGNLPYNVGTAIIRRYLHAPEPPRAIVATLQAEVAQRMAAAPGRLTYLAVEMQVFAEARVLFRVPPRAFRPPPKVDSAVVRLDVRPQPAVEAADIDSFLEFAQAGFAAPRKRLRNSLAVGLRVESAAVDALLADAGIDGEQRPAVLSLDDWRAIFRAYQRS